MFAEWATYSLFNEVAALLVLAAAVGFGGFLLRQPLIVSFIVVGILAGPSVLGIARSSEPIDLLAELGIVILLFLIGIKLDLKLVQTLGLVALATGLGQIIFTTVFGFFIGLLLGFDAITSIYVAIAMAFSSTIIIVKLLSDKREIDSLHGRIAIGFLIVQDLVVVFAMISLSAIGVGAAAGSTVFDVLIVFASSIGMLGLVLLFIRYLANPLTERLARSPELLLTFSIGLAAALAALGATLGFGKELGGLLAGVALASSPYRDSIGARLAPLRDFLLLFFFIALGSQLDIGNLGDVWLAAVVLSAFVLIGNPLIVLTILVAMGYRRRTGFLSGLAVAQISEFSLIFMAVGVGLGHVTEGALGLVTMMALITIATSTYMITYSHELYERGKPFLGVFDRPSPREDGDSGASTNGRHDAIIMGLGRYGTAIGKGMANRGLSVLGVDFSPVALKEWRLLGFPGIYGDVSDPEFLAHLPLNKAGSVVSTLREQGVGGVSHADGRKVLVQALREHGFKGVIAITADGPDDLLSLADVQADLVLQPFTDAADQAVDRVLDRTGINSVPALPA